MQRLRRFRLPARLQSRPTPRFSENPMASPSERQRRWPNMSPCALLRFAFVFGLALVLSAPQLVVAQNAPSVDLKLDKVIDGLSSPVQMVDANDGTGRFF